MRCFLAHCNDIHQPASIIFLAGLLGIGTLLFIVIQVGSDVMSITTVRILRFCAFGMLFLVLSYLPLYSGGGGWVFTLSMTLHFFGAILFVGAGSTLALRAEVFVEPYLKYISRVMAVTVIALVPFYAYVIVQTPAWMLGAGTVERIGFGLLIGWFLVYGLYLMRTNIRS